MAKKYYFVSDSIINDVFYLNFWKTDSRISKYVRPLCFNFFFCSQNMQLMYEHLSILADLNKRHDTYFNEANTLKEKMLQFKVN